MHLGTNQLLKAHRSLTQSREASEWEEGGTFKFLRILRTNNKTELEMNKTPAKHRDIFRDTLIAKKYAEGEVRTHDLAGKQKNSSTSLGSNPGPTT